VRHFGSLIYIGPSGRYVTPKLELQYLSFSVLRTNLLEVKVVRYYQLRSAFIFISKKTIEDRQCSLC
jgi:hypothetical protein